MTLFSFRTNNQTAPLHVILCLSLWLALPTAHTWFLKQLGLNETYRVHHLSTHYTRVFLSITVKSKSFPTLIESRWPECYAPLSSTIFPSATAHACGAQKPRDCRRIQQAIWSQVDNFNRLWVMDIGWQESSNGTAVNDCRPKLLVYDLLRHNAEVLRIDCGQHISPKDTRLLSIKLGPPPMTRCQDVEKYVYFLRADNSHILAYDIIEQRWQQRLLVSRKFANLLPEELLPIKPIDMAFGKRQNILISDVDGRLYSSANALLEQHDTNNSNIATNAIDKSLVGNGTSLELDGSIELEPLGSLLGPSRGMMTDTMDVLYYVVPKFGAVVRCPHYRQNLTAEGNEIIYMTNKNIQQIFFRSENSVWLVTERVLQPHDHCFAGLT